MYLTHGSDTEKQPAWIVRAVRELAAMWARDELTAAKRSKRRLKKRLFSHNGTRNSRPYERATVYLYVRPAGHRRRAALGIESWLDDGSKVFERLFSHEGTRNSRSFEDTLSGG